MTASLTTTSEGFSGGLPIVLGQALIGSKEAFVPLAPLCAIEFPMALELPKMAVVAGPYLRGPRTMACDILNTI
jgi:hypothetical protein